MNSEPAEQLRQKGLRVTVQRLAVLRTVNAMPHCTADHVAAAVRAELGTISRQAVYDVLGTLAEAQLIRRVQPAGSPALFDPRVGDNHHHMICRSCGTVVDVDCAVGKAPCLAVANTDYRIDEAEVNFWGLCPACLAKEPGASE